MKIKVGGLYLCHEPQKEHCNDAVLALLQGNGRYGCTDFIANGFIDYQDTPWQLYVYDEEKTVLFGSISLHEKSLTIQVKDSHSELKFFLSSEKRLEKQIQSSCSTKAN